MKKKIRIITIILLLAFTSTFAKDIIILRDGKKIYGDIIKFKKNSFIIETDQGKVTVANNDVFLTAFDQELTDIEKYRLGYLDGKRAGKERAFGNAAIGFFSGLIGGFLIPLISLFTGAIASLTIYFISSDKDPINSNIDLASNQVYINDIHYVEGFKKGFRKKALGSSLIGTGTSFLFWLVLAVIAVSSVS